MKKFIVVKVDEDIWQSLHIMKIKSRKKSLNEVIKELIKCYKKQHKEKLQNS